MLIASNRLIAVLRCIKLYIDITLLIAIQYITHARHATAYLDKTCTAISITHVIKFN